MRTTFVAVGRSLFPNPAILSYNKTIFGPAFTERACVPVASSPLAAVLSGRYLYTSSDSWLVALPIVFFVLVQRNRPVGVATLFHPPHSGEGYWFFPTWFR